MPLPVGHDRIPERRPGVRWPASLNGVDAASNFVSERRILLPRRGRKRRAIDQASERGWVHGGIAAITFGIEIVRRMAAISQIHAPSSPGDADERTMAHFPSAHCVDILRQVTFDAFGPSRFAA
jgi:hypothetical protein